MPALSVLQISDLHRDLRSPIRTDALLTSLDNDCRRYALGDARAIKRPDIIVVNGDIIHGVTAGSPDAAMSIDSQYREAQDFLRHLADRFVGGNRERVVIVPGNHDVCADHVAPPCANND